MLKKIVGIARCSCCVHSDDRQQIHQFSSNSTDIDSLLEHSVGFMLRYITFDSVDQQRDTAAYDYSPKVILLECSFQPSG